METLFRILVKVSKILSLIGGAALTFMMFLTVADVVLRAGGHPILGTYELVSLSLAIVIGFSIPKVSLERGHVFMEILLEKLSKRDRAIMNTFTRVLGAVLFGIIAYNLLLIGKEYHMSGEVSSTLKIPFYPVVYFVGICCFVECLVFLSDILKVWRGEYE